MKCFNHEERDAVATCQICGKGLCKECASKHTPCMCDECYEMEQEKIKFKEMERRQQQQLDEFNREQTKEHIKSQALVDTKQEFYDVVKKGVVSVVIFVGLMIFSISKGSVEAPPYGFITWPLMGFIVFSFPCGFQLVKYVWDEFLYFIDDFLDGFFFIGIIGILIGLWIKLVLKLAKYIGMIFLAFFVGWAYFIVIVIKYLIDKKRIENS